MSPRARTGSPGAVGELAVPAWRVRAGELGDSEQLAASVAQLLQELGATPPPAGAMREAARALLEDPASGSVFIAEADGVVGVLSTSWQSAIHVPGRYGLIQDLWVHPSWRSRAIGGALLAALVEHARELGIARLEVGLPREGFAGLEATAAFYRANGFEELGPRMRTVLA